MKQTAFEALPSYGSYFQLYSYRNLSDAKEYDFAVHVVKEAGVATIPVSAFYKRPQEHQVLRFCFAKQESTLTQAVDKLIKLK
jgi:methionine aminotransferase